ncbi:type IV pilus assembly protein PilY1 [Plasticicumulans lactativorans]|uniref:Type IV pilus assembly protein PilY1 n=1 Tax=Plasticicumulans lactativorans TaxID=1133106 RepID=A0A4R2LLI3_9GAMM|nr:PilC/PilY family type IV pilus protein [Plasticicumulans lactativorans]TCO80275.1 type IV pilus assembly protein PilY1 [Plasticicumulans lactativorans]
MYPPRSASSASWSLATLRRHRGAQTARGPWLIVALVLACFMSAAHALTLPQTPITYYQAPVLAMLAMGKDHTLFYKAFNDYSDLDGDGIPELTYNKGVRYFGYFDSGRCYEYISGLQRFSPSIGKDADADYYCPTGGNLWSGNFLNWATMTRMDIIRRVLYGGMRIVDDDAYTVLERAAVPRDGHAWVKVYSGSDMNRLTPLSDATISLCNVSYTDTSDGRYVPLMRVARGSWPRWASNGYYQCEWRENYPVDPVYGTSGNLPTASDKIANGYKAGEFIVRAEVCQNNHEEDNCKTYPTGKVKKPTGIIQQYGDDNVIRFGLLTGSYRRNISGGVLRKNIGVDSNEISVSTDGRFIGFNSPPSSENSLSSGPRGFWGDPAPSFGGMIRTLDLLQVTGYNGSNYSGDGCGTPGMSNFANDICNSFGNPEAEIYLEAVRYYTALSSGPTAAFLPTAGTSDANKIPHMPGNVTWTDPQAAFSSTDKQCVAKNVVFFSSSANSFDSNLADIGNAVDGITTDLDTSTGVISGGVSAVRTETKNIGTAEGLTGSFFVGRSLTAGQYDQICTAKTVTDLSQVDGICPEAPRLKGGYEMAGLALIARRDHKINTYGISLAPASPSVTIAEAGTGGRRVTLIPACQSYNGSTFVGSCGLLNFRIDSQQSTTTTATGRLYVSWDDSEQGSDYELDVDGFIDYEINWLANTAKVSTTLNASSATFRLGFGYVIAGTTQDGFHAHSGLNGYTFKDPTGTPDCESGCTLNSNPALNVSARTYPLGTSSARNLPKPLELAAKWGGFIDTNKDGVPQPDEWKDKSYFSVANPNELAASLGKIFDLIATTRSGAALTANSSTLQTSAVVYRTTYDASDWSGDVIAYPLDSSGNVLVDQPLWQAREHIPAPTQRNIYTVTDPNQTGKGVAFTWTSISNAQQKLLESTKNSKDGQAVLDYLRGNQSQEASQVTNGYRTRKYVLGDVIGSAATYVAASDEGRSILPGSEGSSYQSFVQSKASRPSMLYFGANDGMLHGIAAADGSEKLAYVPYGVFANLNKLAQANYAHQYYVDATPVVGDAYNNGWKTILLGTLGNGGKSLFALDVSAPTAFTSSQALWEFTNARLGEGARQPLIARTNSTAHPWVAIVGNAYNTVVGSGNNASVNVPTLLVIDLWTGALVKELVTTPPVAGDNGLSPPTAFDANDDGKVDYVYAGDLLGNLWKFDLSSSNESSWNVAFSNTPLFSAKDSAGRAQAITVQPLVEKHPDSGIMVYFGTGRYLTASDHTDPVLNPNPTDGTGGTDFNPVNSLYGLRDTGSSVIAGRSALLAQSITYEGTPSGFSNAIRITSNTAIDWTQKRGWYMDLLSGGSIFQGERVVVTPARIYERLVVLTSIPTQSSCQKSGYGWLMELNALSGQALTYSALDYSGDNTINASDIVTAGTVSGINENRAPSAKRLDDIGMPTGITILGKGSSSGDTRCEGGACEIKIPGGTEAVGKGEIELSGGKKGRLTWRQLQ